MKKTVGFIDSLLNYRIFQRYGRCLLRSLVLFRFLRRQGWPVEVRFGVRKTGVDDEGAGALAAEPENVFPGQFGITGHSWLVLEGRPFEEPESQQGIFATTYEYPGRASTG